MAQWRAAQQNGFQVNRDSSTPLALGAKPGVSGPPGRLFLGRQPSLHLPQFAFSLCATNIGKPWLTVLSAGFRAWEAFGEMGRGEGPDVLGGIKWNSKTRDEGRGCGCGTVGLGAGAAGTSQCPPLCLTHGPPPFILS